MSCCSSVIPKSEKSRFSDSTFTQFNQSLPLVFVYGDREIGNAYHVTEVKFAEVQAMDCGANSEAWSETRIQLMDLTSPNDNHMTLGKFLNILLKAGHEWNGSSNLQFEIGRGGEAMALYQGGPMSERSGRIEIFLQPTSANCKPAQRSSGVKENSSCCGQPKRTEAACCS